MGQQPQLNLGVVRVHQHIARGGDEHFPHFRAQLRPHGDVLQVRLRGGEPPRCGDGVLEAGVNPRVVRDDLGQALHIGGVELGQLTVLQHAVHHRVEAPELVQHLGAGGVAPAGLLSGGQLELVEQHLAQLLGGVDVELQPRLLVDAPLGASDALGQRRSEALQRVPVHQNACTLHLGQHRAQGQLYGLKQLRQAVFGQLRLHFLPERPHSGGGAEQVRGGLSALLRLVRERLPGLSAVQRRAAVGLKQLRQLIAPGGGVEQVGGQRRVEHKALGAQTRAQQQVHQLLDAVGLLAHGGGEELFQRRLIALLTQHIPGEDHADGFAAALHTVHRHSGQIRQSQHGHSLSLPPQGEQGFQLLLRGGHLHGAAAPDFLRRVLRRGRLLRREAEAVNQPVELQLTEELIQPTPLRLLPQILLRLEGEGRVAADGGQLIGAPGILAALVQPSALGGFQVQRVELFIDCGHAAIFLNQTQSALFPDALDAGVVVRRVAHQGLEVDEPLRLKAVLRPEGVGGHVLGGGAAHAGGHELDRGLVCDELEGVLVAGDDDAAPALLLAAAGDGAHQVVGLPAVHLVHGHAHGGQDVLEHGHLGTQLVGHGVAVGLVVGKGQVPEGGCLPVEGDAQGVGLLLVQQAGENVQKAVDGVGVLPVPGGEQFDAVKGPVRQGIAVQDHQFHRVHLSVRSFRARRADEGRGLLSQYIIIKRSGGKVKAGGRGKRGSRIKSRLFSRKSLGLSLFPQG